MAWMSSNLQDKLRNFINSWFNALPGLARKEDLDKLMQSHAALASQIRGVEAKQQTLEEGLVCKGTNFDKQLAEILNHLIGLEFDTDTQVNGGFSALADRLGPIERNVLQLTALAERLGELGLALGRVEAAQKRENEAALNILQSWEDKLDGLTQRFDWLKERGVALAERLGRMERRLPLMCNAPHQPAPQGIGLAMSVKPPVRNGAKGRKKAKK